MATTAERFRDGGERFGIVGERLLVTCPRCNECASLTFTLDVRSVSGACVCVKCGYNEKNAFANAPSLNSEEIGISSSDFGFRPLAAAKSYGL